MYAKICLYICMKSVVSKFLLRVLFTSVHVLKLSALIWVFWLCCVMTDCKLFSLSRTVSSCLVPFPPCGNHHVGLLSDTSIKALFIARQRASSRALSLWGVSWTHTEITSRCCNFQPGNPDSVGLYYLRSFGQIELTTVAYICRIIQEHAKK